MADSTKKAVTGDGGTGPRPPKEGLHPPAIMVVPTGQLAIPTTVAGAPANGPGVDTDTMVGVHVHVPGGPVAPSAYGVS